MAVDKRRLYKQTLSVIIYMGIHVHQPLLNVPVEIHSHMFPMCFKMASAHGRATNSVSGGLPKQPAKRWVPFAFPLNNPHGFRLFYPPPPRPRIGEDKIPSTHLVLSQGTPPIKEESSSFGRPSVGLTLVEIPA